MIELLRRDRPITLVRVPTRAIELLRRDRPITLVRGAS